MKKTLLFVLIVFLVINVVACDGNQINSNAKTTENNFDILLVENKVIDENSNDIGGITPVLSASPAVVLTENYPSLSPTAILPISESVSFYLLSDFEILNQNDFPTGCESVSAVMVLNYLGFDITKKMFIDEYLDTISSVEEFYSDAANSEKNAHDYYFVGNPRKESGTACNPPVIVNAVTKYLADVNETDVKCKDYTGSSFDVLVKKLKDGNPVLLWVFVDLRIPTKTRQVGKYTEFTNRHTCVLIGVDEDKDVAYIADPISGKCLEWPLSRVKHCYEVRGCKAAIIEK